MTARHVGGATVCFYKVAGVRAMMGECYSPSLAESVR